MNTKEIQILSYNVERALIYKLTNPKDQEDQNQTWQMYIDANKYNDIHFLPLSIVKKISKINNLSEQIRFKLDNHIKQHVVIPMTTVNWDLYDEFYECESI